MKAFLRLKGGSGSGHHGHSGRPGKRGGSLPGTGGDTDISSAITALERGMYDLKMSRKAKGHLAGSVVRSQVMSDMHAAVDMLGSEWKEKYSVLYKQSIAEQETRKGKYNYNVDVAARFAFRELLKDLKKVSSSKAGV